MAPSPQSPIGAAVADAVEPSAGLSGAPVAKVAANKVTATWAGDVDGGKATIAISAKDGVAIAYVCDGNRVEAWLQGTAADGKLDLTGKKAKLTGTFANGRATGTVNVSPLDLHVRRRRREEAVRPLPGHRRRAQRRGGQRLDRGRQGGRPAR